MPVLVKVPQDVSEHKLDLRFFQLARIETSLFAAMSPCGEQDLIVSASSLQAALECIDSDAPSVVILGHRVPIAERDRVPE